MGAKQTQAYSQAGSGVRQAEFLDYPRRQASEDEACFIHEDEYGHIWAYSNNGFFSYYNPKKHVFQQSYMLNDATKTMYEGINRVYYIDNHKKCMDGSGRRN